MSLRASPTAAAEAAHTSESLVVEAPHVGREAEYEAVVSFVARRWSHDANAALFVCGGCGCGKTSTVKRALRAMSRKVLPCDATGRTLVKHSTAAERGWDRQATTTAVAAATTDLAGSVANTPRNSHQRASDGAAAAGLPPALSPIASGRPSASSDDSTASVLAAAGPIARGSRKRTREDESDEADAGSATASRKRGQLRGARDGSATTGAAATPYSLDYFHARYPEVFGSSAPPSRSSSRSLFGHYVNCADVSGPLLVEAICDSIRATSTRGDSASQALLQQLAHLSAKTPSSTSSAAMPGGARPAAKSALHVVALDEVEYVRGGGARTLAQLAELAFRLPGQLALIFISNQRAFVHVPQMMLEALLFEPYSETQLRCIGAEAAAAELLRCERAAGASLPAPTPRRATRATTAGSAPPPLRASDVDIKPRLYDYIARKALLEFSGDVRQVMAMCHRVVSVAWGEVAYAKAAAAAVVAAAAAAPKTRKTPGICNKEIAASPKVSADLPSKLESVVERYSSTTSSTRSSTEHGAGTRTSGRGSTDNSAASPPTCSPSGVMTLARSVRLLQGNQIESDIDRHVGTLPEQTLYVLSCIVVLTLRRQEERTHATTSVGGRMGTGRTPGAGVPATQRALPSLSLKMHEVHQLYTRLMADLHFPAMRADGFPLQVECLADFGVLTRPQLRGTDRIFSLNGTWTLQAMQQALVRRGESIRQDRLAAGAEVVMENKFEEVLRELSRLVSY